MCGCQSVLFQLRVRGFESDIRLRRLLVAVSLCSVSVVCVCVCVCVCVWVWIRYQASSATCGCQSVFCFSSVNVCVRVLAWIRYQALSATCGCQSVLFQLCVRGFGSDVRLCRLLVAVSLCSISVLCVHALVWIRYQTSSATCSCQYVFCSSCLFKCVCVCVCVCGHVLISIVGSSAFSLCYVSQACVFI